MAEIFDVVDENDRVIDQAARDECHKKGLLHRAVHIILLNSKGQMLLQKRSMKKDLYKGWWIDAAAGHVDAGESYDHAAAREIREELGVEVGKDVALEHLMKIRKRHKGDSFDDNEIIAVYLIRNDGPFTVPKDEIDFVRFYEPRDVRKMLKTENFTPGTQAVFDTLAARPEVSRKIGLFFE